MSTFAALLLWTTFAVALSHRACARKPETHPWRPRCSFHRLSDGWNVPGTSVDSTFQVLLCSVRNVNLY